MAEAAARDFEFVEDATSDGLTCSICLLPFVKEPKEIQPCGHVFCGPCIVKLSKCPECRGKIKARNTPNRIILNMLWQLKGTCSVCRWQGSYEAFTCTHVKSPCERPPTPPAVAIAAPAPGRTLSDGEGGSEISSRQSSRTFRIVSHESRVRHIQDVFPDLSPDHIALALALCDDDVGKAVQYLHLVKEEHEACRGGGSPTQAPQGPLAPAPAPAPAQAQPMYAPPPTAPPATGPFVPPPDPFSSFSSANAVYDMLYQPPGAAAGGQRPSPPPPPPPLQQQQQQQQHAGGAAVYQGVPVEEEEDYSSFFQQGAVVHPAPAYPPLPPEAAAAFGVEPRRDGTSLQPAPRERPPWVEYNMTEELYSMIMQAFTSFEDTTSNTVRGEDAVRILRWVNLPHTSSDVAVLLGHYGDGENAITLKGLLLWGSGNQRDPSVLYGMTPTVYVGAVLAYHSIDTGINGYLLPPDAVRLTRMLLMLLGKALPGNSAEALVGGMQARAAEPGRLDFHEILLYLNDVNNKDAWVVVEQGEEAMYGVGPTPPQHPPAGAYPGSHQASLRREESPLNSALGRRDSPQERRRLSFRKGKGCVQQ